MARVTALLQKSNPGVAVAVKTRQATRTVLNKITDTLFKLKEDGLIDENEAERLCTVRLLRLTPIPHSLLMAS